jgi:hypothetical protein
MMGFDERAAEAPAEICELAERCVVHVRSRLAFELDYTVDTISVLDHFVASILAEEGEGEPPPRGHARRAALMHLLAPTVGAYFGEVLRRAFPCRWRFTAEPAEKWAIEFEQVVLRINPAGAAAEAFFGDTVDGWSGAIVTAKELEPIVRERLAVAPPVPEDEFFTFAARHEALQIVEDYLGERAARLGAPDCSAAGYDRMFGPA